MNKNILRKIIILVGCSLMILAALYPPYKKTIQNPQRHQEIPIGFYSIFYPPEQMPVPKPDAGMNLWDEIFKKENLVERHYSIQIDFQRLLLIWFSIVVVTGLCYFLIRETAHKKEVQS